MSNVSAAGAHSAHDVLGLLVTAPGFAVIRELSRLLPAVLDPVVTTALLRSVSPAGIAEYWTMLDYVLDQVASANPQYVLQNTVVVSLTGEVADVVRLQDLIQQRTGAKSIVGSRAVVDTLNELDIKRPLVVMPYMQEIRDRMGLVLNHFGVDAIGWIGPQMQSPGDIHRSNAAGMRDLIVEGLRDAGPNCDAVLISGGGWPSLDLVRDLEREFSIPVLSSNIAQARQLAQVSGLPEKEWR